MPTKDVDAHLSPDYLKNGSLILASSVILGFVADYLFNLTLSNALPSHEYGDYKVAYAFIVITSVICLLGGDRVAPRILSGPLSQGNNRTVWEFLRFYFAIAVGLSIVIIFFTGVISFFHLGTTDTKEHHPILLMSFAIPLIALGALLSRVLQSAKRLALSNLPWRVALPILKTTFVLLLISALPIVKLWQVIIGGIIAAGIIIIWQWHKIRQLNLVEMERAPQAFKSRGILKLSIPMMLATLVALALNQIDLFFLEVLADEHEVGVFAAASTTAHILPVVQTTIVGLFLPLIGSALDLNKVKSARALFWKGQKLITLSVITITVFLIIAGQWLLSFFGKDFLNAQDAMMYLIIGYALWALTAFSSTWLQYSNQGKPIILIGITTLTIDAVCNLWLIPLYGINGAAIATLIAMTFASIMTWGVYYRCSISN